jgi:methylmalonyl-CoA mutase N-terminal domain/subunit
VIAHETGVTSTIDPLGGSWFVESLTDQMEQAAYQYFERIEELGGMVEAVKQNFPQREIAEASWRYQTEVEDGRRLVVGVNTHEQADEAPLEILRIDPELERKQIGRLQATRARRDSAAVESALAALGEAAADSERNLMPHLIDCARALCSEGEMIETMQSVFGSYRETPVF